MHGAVTSSLGRYILQHAQTLKPWLGPGTAKVALLVRRWFDMSLRDYYGPLAALHTTPGAENAVKQTRSIVTFWDLQSRSRPRRCHLHVIDAE